MHYTDAQLEQLIRDANDRAHSGRFKRLRILFSVKDLGSYPIGDLAFEYYEEARLCWYMGAYVAAIVMTQLAFEEMLRSHYRVAKGVGGNLNDRKKVDDAGFADLINQAKGDGWISSEEAAALHKIRRDYRNPYVHPHDFDESNDFSKANFLRQSIKITAPNLVGGGAEGEARESISLLITLLPTISRRFWGMNDDPGASATPYNSS